MAITFEALEIKGNFFTLYDNEGNNLYGFVVRHEDGSQAYYEAVGANFKSASFTREKTYWKRDKRGQVSRAFYEWEAVARQEVYQQFYGLKKEAAK